MENSNLFEKGDYSERLVLHLYHRMIARGGSGGGCDAGRGGGARPASGHSATAGLAAVTGLAALHVC
jgi:hypothetical protein